ncbi:MAG: CotH kinase family protein [Bacteroidota bacterium]
MDDSLIILGQDGSTLQYAAFRFPNLAIEPGQTISNAYLQFQSVDIDTAAANLSIYAHATGNAPVFSNLAALNDISGRTPTANVLAWQADPWDEAFRSGDKQKTPDLSPILQEIVNRNDWVSGNAMAFIISGSGTRRLNAFERNQVEAPRLVIDFVETDTVDAISGLFINEIMANNGGIIFDEYQERDDWVELYNAHSQPVSIGGLFLSDEPGNLNKWQIADNTVIPAGGHAVVWLDDDPSQGGLHSNGVRLDINGDELILSQSQAGELVVLDSISFGQQLTNVSFGRLPDGSGVKILMTPTPAATNNTAVQIIATPQFSVEAGFYNSSQSLEITTTTPGATIYYTTDGKVPTTASIPYTGPISLTQSSFIRARAFSNGMNPSSHVSASYFINQDEPLPVMSFITDPDSMLGDSLGIYIYDNSVIGGRKEWERNVFAQFFDSTGKKNFAGDYTTRLFGRTAIFYAQKSLSLDVPSAEDIDSELFFDKPGVTSFESLLLRSSSDDWQRTMFADAFQQSLIHDYLLTGIQAYQPTILYINGAYFGINNLREKYNENYLQANYGADPKNVDLIKKVPGSSSGVDEVLSGTIDHYANLRTFIQNNDQSIASNYAYAKTQMNIDDYIDFCIAEIFVNNRSWRHNRRYWRPRTPDGKWRWLINDLDRGFQDTNRDVLSEFVNDDDFFSYLLANDEFKHEFIQRAATWMNTCFREERAVQKVDSLAAIVGTEINDHITRWSPQGGLSSFSTWESRVQTFRTFASDRPAKFKGQIQTEFSLNTSMYTLNLVVTDTTPGNVYINEIDFEVPNLYSGDYFENVPLKISAKANNGYQFVKWLETGNTNATIYLNTSTNTTLTPVFEAKFPIITEIHYNPSNGADYEYVELYNPNGTSMDLNGFYFDEGITDTLNFILPAKSYAIIAANARVWSGIRVYQWDTGSLSNSGEQIRLKSPSGETAESLEFKDGDSWPEAADGSGASLQLKAPYLDNDKGKSWRACCAQITPGAANDLPVRGPGAISNGLALWLRAERDAMLWTGEGDDYVQHWIDYSGDNRDATSNSIDERPDFQEDTLNNNPLVSFDGLTHWLSFNKINNIRTVFFVSKLIDPPSKNGLPILGEDNGYDFHGGPTGEIFHTTHAATEVQNGAWEQNGISIAGGSTQHTGDFNILSVVTTGDVSANQLVRDRDIASRLWQGDIAEVIIYDRALSSAEIIDVTSYLNIKYAIPVPVGSQQYYTYASYANDIAGIGKADSTQCLYQKNSRSLTGGIVQMRKPNDLNEGEYQVWGHNGQTINGFNRDFNGLQDNGIARKWRVAEIGNIGEVQIQVPKAMLPVGTNAMFVSPDNTFPLGQTRVILLEPDGDELEGWVDFDHGDFLSFGSVSGPGGVGESLTLWLKADQLSGTPDGQAISNWEDQSGRDHDASAPGSDQPSFQSDSLNLLNYYPVVEFDNERLATTNISFGDEMSLFVVGKMNPSSDSWARVVHTNYQSHYLMRRRGSTNQYSHILSANSQGSIGDWDLLSHLIGDGSGLFWENGHLEENISATLSAFNGPMSIGGNISSQPGGSGAIASQMMDGAIAEIVVFDSALAPRQRMAVQSYLAIKYGISLDQSMAQDYITPDSSVIWHAEKNQHFNEDIAGIGRSDVSGLNQTRARSINDDDILEINMPTPWLEDESYLMWGNNGKSYQGVPTNFEAGVYYEKFARLWRVDKKGQLNPVSVRFDLNGLGLDLSDPNRFALLVDGDTNLTNAVVYYPGAIYNGTIQFNDVELKDGYYLTLATELCGPNPITTEVVVAVCDPANVGADTTSYTSRFGCDSLAIVRRELGGTMAHPGNSPCNLRMWLKGDEGLTFESGVRIWQDQSGNGADAFQADGTDQPLRLDNAMNGHDVLAFDGVNDWMKVNSIATTISGNSSVFTVFLPESNGGDGYYLSSHLGGSNRLKFGHRPNGELIYDDDAPSLALGNWLNQAVITSFIINGTTNIDGYVNGNEENDWTGYAITGADRASIGQEYDGSGGDNETSNHWHGQLAEMIVYDSILGPAERQQIETYFAIKYGITIPVDTHLYYQHNAHPNFIAGIGINTEQGLLQNSSRSVHDGSILRISGADDLEDGEYLVWGADNGPATAADASSDILSGFKNRMGRSWRISETGEVGLVDLSFDLSGLGWTEVDVRSWKLVIDGAGDFSGSPDKIITADEISDGKLIFFNVSLEDGDWLTIAPRHYVLVAAKAYLQGPFDFGSGLMNDDLRDLELIPQTEPYSALSQFSHNGNEEVSENILKITGTDAVVDWVLLEVRDAVNPAQILGTRAALLQRDGDIVDTDGVSAVIIEGVEASEYYFSVRHRNHLGVMSQDLQLLGETALEFDFSDPSTLIYGVDPQASPTPALRALWAGDVSGNGEISFQGGLSDPSQIFFSLLSEPGNTTFARNYIYSAYDVADVNMDGNVIFQGLSSDAITIFLSVLSAPGNTSFARNFIIQEQLP